MKLICLKLCLFSFWLERSAAKTPDAEIRFANDNSLLERATYGTFGSRKTIRGTLQPVPIDNPKLCLTNISDLSNSFTEQDILLVPRGDCSFELKSSVAKSYGAAGVVIYNTMESRYDFNGSQVKYPIDQQDYDCSLGGGGVSLPSPPFAALDPPAYNSTVHDSYLTFSSPANLCLLESPSECTSQRCLVTEKSNSSADEYHACCAWDIWVGMAGDATLDEDTDDIVAVFITMEQADGFLDSHLNQAIEIQARWYPPFNVSSFGIWFLATFITALAAYVSAQDYRRARYKLTHPIPQPQQPEVEMVETTTAPPPVGFIDTNDGGASQENGGTTGIHGDSQEADPSDARSGQAPPEATPAEAEEPLQLSLEDEEVTPPNTPITLIGPPQEEANVAPPSATADARSQPPQNSDQQPQEEEEPNLNRRHRSPRIRRQPRSSTPVPVELTVWHAALFVIFASATLLLLFTFEFYTAVTLLYGVGCSGALVQLIFRPVLVSLSSCHATLNKVMNLAICPKLTACSCNEVTFLDALACICGYFVGVMWLVVGFKSDNPSQNAFYWITQNVMGGCICILFLSIMRLNSVKVATVLLLAVFVYDIFFVFISPYIFGGDSVMVAVATSGGPSEEVTADHCEKYPGDRECRAGQPLPMLLAIPRVNDFRGGSSLLGLGDIVLPGLLISFGARLDDAKRLVGGHTTLAVHMPPRGGYLLFLTIGYAVGLLLANIAVVLMGRGQPALLYLVPSTLGTLVAVGWGELSDLWKGPNVLLWADRLVRYCDAHAFISRDTATVAGSLDDLELEEEIDSAGDEMEQGIVTDGGSRRELT